MGDVATLFKVYLEAGTEGSVSSGIKALRPKSMQIEEIGFGIKTIRVLFVHTDEEGSTPYEEKLKAIKGVSEVEVEEQTLL